MNKSLTPTLVILLLSAGLAQAPVFEREIIVMFKPGVIGLPIGVTEVQLSEVDIAIPAIKDALVRRNAEVIIRAFPDFKLADTLGVARTGEIVKLADLTNIYKIRFPEKRNIPEVAAELTAFTEVIYAEPNGIAIPAVTYPNDPRFDDPNNPGQGGDQWNLLNTGQNGGADDADIDAPEAWDIIKGSTNTRIGIIDWGVRSAHEDLTGKVSGDSGYNGSHGTHVAGIAAANTNNSKGIAGIDWNARIESQRIDWATGDEDIYNAIMAAVNNESDIINNSWTLCSNCDDPVPDPRYSTTVRLAFSNAYKLNIMATAAMGNYDSGSTYYPAGYGQGIIAVGATDHDDDRWWWSSTSGSNYGTHIDVAAPGEYVWSATASSNSSYDDYTGTSMATPHVSGISGLLLAKKSDLYNDDIEQIIRISAEDKGATGFDIYYGTGRVNARDALDLISSPNEVKQWTASGGSSVGNTGTYQATWYSVPGLADGVYLVKRYDVRKTVTFPQSFASIPYAWGRGVATNGYSAANPNFGMGWCNVVPGSVTATQATLQTYVYQVWTILGYYLGWYPASPGNATFAYTVLAPPPENLTLENLSIGTTEVYVATNSITAGPNFTVESTGDVTFQAGNVITLKPGFHAVAGSKFHAYIDDDLGGGRLGKIIATAPDVKGIEGHVPEDENDDSLPAGYSLSHAYPNPFNPNTTIRFSLPEAAPTRLVVYDLLGREVVRLVDGNLEAGYHAVRWNGKIASGREVPSGIYIALMSTPTFTKSIKLLLLK